MSFNEKNQIYVCNGCRKQSPTALGWQIVRTETHDLVSGITRDVCWPEYHFCEECWALMVSVTDSRANQKYPVSFSDKENATLEARLTRLSNLFRYLLTPQGIKDSKNGVPEVEGFERWMQQQRDEI